MSRLSIMSRMVIEKNAALQRNAPAEELRDDLVSQINLQGNVDSAAKVMPAGELREKLKGIVAGNAEQRGAGLLGAAGGGLLGAGTGALISGLSKGRASAKWGLLGGLPLMAVGYDVGKQRARDKQILTVLEEKLGPGAGIKQAKADPYFAEALKNLTESKISGDLTLHEIQDDLVMLKESRDRGLNPSEKLLMRKHLFGHEKMAAPQMLSGAKSFNLLLDMLEQGGLQINDKREVAEIVKAFEKSQGRRLSARERDLFNKTLKKNLKPAVLRQNPFVTSGKPGKSTVTFMGFKPKVPEAPKSPAPAPALKAKKDAMKLLDYKPRTKPFKPPTSSPTGKWGKGLLGTAGAVAALAALGLAASEFWPKSETIDKDSK